MDDTKKDTHVVNTPTTTNNEDNNGGNKKSFSQEDMDALAGKIRSEEKAKTEQVVKDAVANAMADYDRQAKLSQEEKDKEAISKRDAEAKSREDNLTLRENKLEAKELLASKGIPVDMVDFVVDLDMNKTKENIEKFAKTYNKSVETGVVDKLKGAPPEDFSNTHKSDDKPKKVISAF